MENGHLENLEKQMIPSEKTVLVIDDDPIVLNLITEYIKNEGFQVLSSLEWEKGLQLCEEHLPSLVLLDIVFPDTNGIEVCKKLKKNEKTKAIPILFLTGSNKIEQKVEAFEAGGEDFINKTVEKEEILARIKSHLRLGHFTEMLRAAYHALYEKQKELDENFRAAAKIKALILPNHTLHFQGCQIEWIYLPSQIVGGDFFNFIPLLGDQFGCYIIDVSGHGMHSALMGVTLHQNFSQIAYNYRNRELLYFPKKLLQFFDREYSHSKFETGYTFAYFFVDNESKTMRYSLAGHPPLLLTHPDKPFELLKSGGPIPGFGKQIPYIDEEKQLEVGSTIIAYTDGIADVESNTGEMFGTERLCEFFEKNKQQSLSDIKSGLIDTINEFAQKDTFTDDITLVMVRVNE